MKKILMSVVMVAVLAACSQGEGEDGFILSPMSDPDDVCSAMDDAYFMQYCYANFDINGDAKVSKTEAATVTSIDLGDGYDRLTSIRGVEYFANLEYFGTDGSGIAVADLRANTKLQKVNFSGCKDLVEVRLPNGVTLIGKSAFSGCSSLMSIKIPKSVTLIGASAFSGCSSLASITIPEGVASIGDYAFSGCSGLTSITIPGSVTSIGRAAFRNCSSLAKIEGKFSSQDGRCLIVDGEMVAFAPYGLTIYAIPEGVTFIGIYAFSGCSSLTSVMIPEGVASIKSGAFYGCSSVTSIMIPEGVTSIGYSAFKNCLSLMSVMIPEGVTSIKEEAFKNCSSLTTVYCNPTTPPRGEGWMFDYDVSGRKIYVPRASVDAYKQAEYWRGYADDIVGYDF